MIEPVDPMRVIADGYDRMAASFETWNGARPPDVRRWFLEEVLSRYGAGSDILELGCGPGIEATALAAGRGYVGVDLSEVQIARAQHRVPGARFVVGDFLSLSFDADSFDAVVASTSSTTSLATRCRTRSRGSRGGSVRAAA
jgi:ubiquinone/menaquinone biosynthesis C-methylase UbiE